MPGTMEKLLLFYGDIRDGPSGLDVSRCTAKIVFVKDMVNRGFLDVKRCIQAEFGPDTVGKNMTVEAFVFVGRVDGTPARWGLRQVKGDVSWGSYMKFASTPGNAMYRRPMVYVWFAEVGCEAGCSNAASSVLQLTTPAGAHTQPVAAMGGSRVREESVVVPTVNGDIAYLHDATIKDMRSIMKDVSEIARAKGLSDYHYDSSNDDDEGGDLSQAPVIRQRTMTPLEESWADGDTARHRDEMIRDMRMLMADVLGIFRMDPFFAHGAASRLINIYETAEKIMKRWSCYRIDGIAFRPYDMTEVRSALPSEAGPSLTTPLNCENSALLHMPANSPLQRSQFGASRPEHQFNPGAMEVDNPFPETSPGGGHTGQCSYDQGQGSDGDESTDEEECDGLD